MVVALNARGPGLGEENICAQGLVRWPTGITSNLSNSAMSSRFTAQVQAMSRLSSHAACSSARATSKLYRTQHMASKTI